MSGAVISLNGVGKTYKGRFGRKTEALTDINFQIKQGEAFGFIGQNGAGKSTTIKIITGGVVPTSGSVTVLGFPASDYRSRVGMAYVPESPLLYNYLTPYEIVSMGAGLSKIARHDVRRHTMEWLDRFGLRGVENKPIRGFSKGMVQRTALAHALACMPRLLILDEPLSGLDPIGRKEVVEILQEYRQGGGALFFSSHVLFDVERLADRFGLIHRGRIRAIKSLRELSGSDPIYRVTIEGASAPEGFVVDLQGRFSQDVSASAMWDILDLVRVSGCSLVEIRSKLSLEQAYVDLVEAEELRFDTRTE